MRPWRRCSRVPDVVVSLAEGRPGRADLATRAAISLQAGSHKGGPGTRSGPLLAISASQTARNGLRRPPAGMVGEDEDRGVERRLLAPPALPAVVAPRAALRVELVAPH